MKYRKKPIVIDAFQYSKHVIFPAWAWIAFTQGTIFPIGEKMFIWTMEGRMLVSDGDFIIKGVRGELYPCKPEIFKETYEEVDANSKP